MYPPGRSRGGFLSSDAEYPVAGVGLENAMISTETGCETTKIGSMTRRSSTGFFILLVKWLLLLICALYDIWEDLGTWRILLRDMPMICLQFWESSKITQTREVSTFFQQLDFDPNRIKDLFYQSKLRPAQ